MAKLVLCDYFLRLTVANIVFILLATLQKVQCGSEFGWLARRMYSAKNKVLKNSVYRCKRTPNYVLCGRDCFMDETCKSFNFYKDKLCEFNNASRAEKPGDFSDNFRSAYFDEDEATFPLSLPDRYESCKKLLEAGFKVSGEYDIYYPDGFTEGLRVYCDMETDGGGWVVFQKRQDGSVDFYRTWEEYKSTFGNLSGEFWLGNDNLVNLTSKGTWELRVDLMDKIANQTEIRKWAIYKRFKMVADMYKIYVGDYDAINSTVGDSLTGDHNNRAFTTKDADHDDSSGNCAVTSEGAWWYKNCYDSSLNSLYLTPSWVEGDGFKGLQWWSFHRKFDISLKETRMEIRELQ